MVLSTNSTPFEPRWSRIPAVLHTGTKFARPRYRAYTSLIN